MTQKNQNHNVQIIVAIVGLIGVIGSALIANSDKLIGKREIQHIPSTTIPSSDTNQTSIPVNFSISTCWRVAGFPTGCPFY